MKNSIRKFSHLACIFVLLTMKSGAAMAADEKFYCSGDSTGDGEFLVTIPQANSNFAFVQFEMGLDHGGTRSEATRLELREGEQFIGNGFILQFHGSSVSLNSLQDNEILTCRRDNVAHNQSANQSASANGGRSEQGASAQSWGGKLRAGPGTNYPQIGSLYEGQPVSVIKNTGVMMDGYPWFEIGVDGKIGYQWGGIMCAVGQVRTTMFQQCPNSSQSSGGSQPASGGGWMAFAISNNGAFGHGAGATLQDAERFALQYCNHSSCSVWDKTQAQCHVLAQSGDGNWFGAANNKEQAERFAIDFCLAGNGRSCAIRYSYCR